MTIGPFHSCGVNVANLNHTFELPAFAFLFDLNNAQSWRAASRSMWAPTRGLGPLRAQKSDDQKEKYPRDLVWGAHSTGGRELSYSHARQKRITTDYATKTFVLDATPLDLANGVTPSGALKQD